MLQKHAYFIFFWMGLLTAVACTTSGPAQSDEPLLIFAASSLTEAFTAVGEAFAADTNYASPEFNFAGSSQLAAQIIAGAPADLFASANQDQMTAAVEAGRITADSVRPFAANRLVVMVPAERTDIQTLADLAGDNVQIVMAAPGVPVRVYTDQLLQTADLDPAVVDRIYANVVSEEDNVRQVSAKVILNEADAGFVYATDAAAGVRGGGAGVRVVEPSSSAAAEAVYYVGVTADREPSAAASAFIDFLQGPRGRTILTEWGFVALTAN